MYDTVLPSGGSTHLQSPRAADADALHTGSWSQEKKEQRAERKKKQKASIYHSPAHWPPHHALLAPPGFNPMDERAELADEHAFVR